MWSFFSLFLFSSSYISLRLFSESGGKLWNLSLPLLLIEKKMDSQERERECVSVCVNVRHSVDPLAWGCLISQQLSLIIRIKVITHTHTNIHGYTSEHSYELRVWLIERHQVVEVRRGPRQGEQKTNIHTHIHTIFLLTCHCGSLTDVNLVLWYSYCFFFITHWWDLICWVIMS